MDGTIRETCDFVITAMEACLKDSEGKPRPHSGIIKCPKCGGALQYLAKTSAHGTIWGSCDSPGCLMWMV